MDKKETYSQLIKSVYPKEFSIQKQQSVPIVKSYEQDLHHLKEPFSVIVDSDMLINYYFCPECKPKMEDKIIAKSGRDGIIIHAVDCRATKTISFDKLLEAHWAGQSDTVYNISIEMKLSNRQGNIIGMMKIFNDLNIPVLQISIKNLLDDMCIISFETTFTNP